MKTAAQLAPFLKFSTPPTYSPLPTIGSIDLPRGRITEIFGPASSGRTTLILSALAESTAARGETCAYIDINNSLDPTSAAGAGVALHKLLWVRCGGNAPHGLKATDMVLQAGSFGVVVLDMGDTPLQITRRIPINYWYRFRRAIEGTHTILTVIGNEPNVRQCATVCIESLQRSVGWSGTHANSRLLDSIQFQYGLRKPVGMPAGVIDAPLREDAQRIIAE
ncbi:MAG: hypothetical protein IT168_11960 [Bryobacterales bacterium]|nr:hypothetical protein [Bryobacterales bacterium]